MPSFIPAQGDFVSLSFDPRSGHEQKGRRPALVVSKALFQRSTGMAIVCPVTNTQRGLPFHVALPEGSVLTGVVMVEQVKSVDYVSRRGKRIEAASNELLAEVLSILDACLY